MTDLVPTPPLEPPNGPEVIVGEVIEGMPGRKELILQGRAALADLGVDPDELVDARTDAQMRRATPENTWLAMRWGYGFLIRYCGITGRKHDPPTVGTMRKLICDSFHMVNAKGKPPGRYGRPYAPRTVELVVYVVSMICDRMQWVNPVRHPWVAEQLKGYREDYFAAGYRTDESDALSSQESIILARSQDLGTVQGLRNAALIRGQFDMGCRADEWCKVQGQDLEWVSEDRVKVRFVRTKGRKERVVSMQAARDADFDVDPVRLLLVYYRARRSAGWDGTGSLWVEVRRGDRRKDFQESGILGGRFLDVPLTYRAYAAAFDRAVAATGIDTDPVTRKKTRHYTTHSERIGFIDAAVRAGFRLEHIAPRTGHSPASPVIHRYMRQVPPWDADNPGLAIRTAGSKPGGTSE